MTNRSILVAVGTFKDGFDALVAAADEAAERLGLEGFAQIGGSRVVPRRLLWSRWLPPDVLVERIQAARVAVVHGGVGLLGEAMRAGRPIVAVPRRGPTTAVNPAGDQRSFLRRLAERYPIVLCEDPEGIATAIETALEGPARIVYPLGSDVPEIVAAYLRGRSLTAEFAESAPSRPPSR